MSSLTQKPGINRPKNLARRVRNEEQAVSLIRLWLITWPVIRCGPFVTLRTCRGSLNRFVLVKARKSRGGDHWSPDDYDVRDNAGKIAVASCFTRKHRKTGRGSGR